MESTPLKRPPVPLQSIQRKRGRWYSERIDFSPPRGHEEEEMKEEEPVLILKRFSQFPTICFENVLVGTTKTVTLQVQNPLERPQRVKLEKFPSEKGFSVEKESFMIGANDVLLLKFSWAPLKSESCRASVVFKTDAGCKTQVFLLATACSPPKKKKFRKRSGGRNRSRVEQNIGRGFTYSSTNIGKENFQLPSSSELQIQKDSLVVPSENEKRTSFFLKTGDDDPAPSPIRRQTFLVSRIFKSASYRSALQAIPIPNTDSLSSSVAESLPVENNAYPSWVKDSGDKAMYRNDKSCNSHSSNSESLPLEDSLMASPPAVEDPQKSAVLKEIKPEEQICKDEIDDKISSVNPLNLALNENNFINDIRNSLNQQVKEVSCTTKGMFQVMHGMKETFADTDVSDAFPNDQLWHTFQINTPYDASTAQRPSMRFQAARWETFTNDKSRQNVTHVETSLRDSSEIMKKSVQNDDNRMPDSQAAQLATFHRIKSVQSNPVNRMISSSVGLSSVERDSAEDSLACSVHRLTFDVKMANGNEFARSLFLPSVPSPDAKDEKQLHHKISSRCSIKSYCINHDSLVGIEEVATDMYYGQQLEKLKETCGSSQTRAILNEATIRQKVEDCVLHESLSNQSMPGNDTPDYIQRCSTGISSVVPELRFPSDSSLRQEFMASDICWSECDQKFDRSIKQETNLACQKPRQVSSAEERPMMKPLVAGRKSLSADLVLQRPKCGFAKVDPFNMRKKVIKQNLFKTPAAVRVTRMSLPRDRKARFSSPKQKRTPKAQPVPKERQKIEHKKVNKVLSAKAKSVIVPPKQLNLIKRKPSDKTRHPNPYAAKNMYYDERWMEKQELSFTRWLNFILTPPDELGTTSDTIKVDAGKLWIESMKDVQHIRAPTKEVMSLKAYTATQRLNILRCASCHLYQSEEVVEVIRRVEMEVDKKKLMVRKDRALHADFGIKKHILGLLMCYNPLWLRIGLETVYGELIPLQNNEDLHGLSRFIAQRLLSNPDIAAKFAHPSVPNFFRPGYDEALKEFTLKKFLLLVHFLDYAKSCRLIDHDPCLFRKNAEYKSSRDLLLIFSREYLSGEGDVTRHLKQLGYIVKHQQGILDEFDYTVTNISVDLRCGIRLCRVMELILHNWKICSSLRLPAISRLQKIHNAEAALKAFLASGYTIDGDVTARDIVDGHREKTLTFLWQIIFKTQISKLLNMKMLEDEIDYLQRSLQLKADVAAFNAIRMQFESSMACRADFVSSNLYEENECIRLLLFWCQAVCGHYGLKIHNFTTSFSDGKALCFLLHHYHPQILPLSDICLKTTMSCFEDMDKPTIGGYEDDVFKTGAVNAEEMDQLLKNEKKNLQLAFEKFQDIGGIPILSRPSDMANTIPDEKVVITLVAYVNIRLMDLSREIRAARFIQLAWRKKCLRKQQERLKVEIDAAIVIQRAVRRFLKHKRLQMRQKAAIVLQTYWRVIKAKKVISALKYKKLMNFRASKAVVIQAAYRSYRVRKILKRKINSCILLQSVIRAWLHKIHFGTIRLATVKIQRWYRAIVLCRKFRGYYLSLKSVIIVFQAYARGRIVRKQVKVKKCAVLKIQSIVRMWLARLKYLRSRMMIIKVQQIYKAKLMSRNCLQQYAKLKQATVQLQKWYRKCKQHQQEVHASVKIQTCYRRYICRKHYLEIRNATLCIQIMWRTFSSGRMQHRHYLETRKSIVVCQSCVRRFLARRDYVLKKQAVIIIQKTIRCIVAIKKYGKIKNSVILIQKWWRASVEGKWQRQVFLNIKLKVITMQSCFRRHHARKDFLMKKRCAIILQKNARSLVAMKTYKKYKRSAILIQNWWRAYCKGRHDRQAFLTAKRNVTSIQACVRRFIALRNFLQKKHSTIIIQKNIRCRFALKRYQRIKSNTILIQRWWRAYLHGKYQRQVFMHTMRNVIFLQSCVRQFIARKIFLRKRQSATIVQKNIRCILAAKRYKSIRGNVILIQRWWRAILEGKRVTKIFAELRSSVMLLQTNVRRYIARSKYLRKKQACLVIQKNLRRALEVRKYQKCKLSAICIQRKWRAYSIGKAVRQWYLALRNAAVVIQAQFKMKEARKFYFKTKQAVRVLEIRWTARCKSLEARRNFLKIQGAVIKIQACYRSYICRKKFRECRRSLVKIQYAVKTYLTRKDFLSKKQAASTIQRFYRTYREIKIVRNNYRKVIRSATLIQAVYRGYRARLKIYLQHYCACVIQREFRGFVCRKRYRELRSVAIVVQRKFRAKRSMQIHMTKYRMMKKSAVIIQSAFCQYLAGKKAEKVEAAIKIQSILRMHAARKNYIHVRNAVIAVQASFRMFRACKKYQSLKKNVLLIQRRYREYQLTKLLRKQYLVKKKACITFQSAYRALLARRKVKRKRAVICIQSCFRMYCQQKVFLKKKSAAIKIQAFIRMLHCRMQYRKYLQATIYIQKLYRLKCEASQIREHYLKTKCACIVVQSAFRGYLARSKVREIKAAIKIQSYYRMCAARKAYVLNRKKIICIQSCIRGFIAWRRKHKYQQAIICLQRRWREKISASRVRRDFLQKRKACVLLQTYFRMLINRKSYLLTRTLCICLQSIIRMKLARKRYLIQRNAVLVIQRSFRNRLLMKITRKSFLEKRRACLILQNQYRTTRQRQRYLATMKKIILLQACVRAFLVRKSWEHKKTASRKIQKWWRNVLDDRQRLQRMNAAAVCFQRNYKGYAQRKIYRKQLQCIIYLQSFARGYLARQLFMIIKLEHSSAAVIQNAFRVYLARKNFLHLKEQRKKVLLGIARNTFLHLMAVRIQRWYRFIQLRKKGEQQVGSIILIQRWWRAELQRVWFVGMRQNVRHFQVRVRRYLCLRNKAAIVIQARVRSWLVRKRTEKMNRAAIKIQAVWKAYRVCQTLSNEQVKTARQKILRANARACRELQLSHRTTVALEHLLKSNSLVLVLNSVIDLDVSTQFSSVCCERVAEAGGVNVLMCLIKSCNRSLPHMDIIRYSINILLNLAKYEKTVSYIWNCQDTLRTILNMMKIFREKGTFIFAKCCSLLWILCQDPKRAEEIKAKSSVIEQITSFHYLVIRQKKLTDKRLQTKARLVELNSSFLPTTNLTPRSKKNLQMQPDWMLGNQFKREFTDPVDAICAVMRALQLETK